MPFKRTPSFINKKRERALSPSRRKDLQKKAQQKEPNGTIPNQIIESPSEPSLAKAASSETSLARTDSGKINTTDVSESTTTTEDYVTANSDSSKKSNCKNQNQSKYFFCLTSKQTTVHNRFYNCCLCLCSRSRK